MSPGNFSVVHEPGGPLAITYGGNRLRLIRDPAGVRVEIQALGLGVIGKIVIPADVVDQVVAWTREVK